MLLSQPEARPAELYLAITSVRKEGRKEASLAQTLTVSVRTALCVAMGNADYLVILIPFWFSIVEHFWTPSYKPVSFINNNRLSYLFDT